MEDIDCIGNVASTLFSNTYFEAREKFLAIAPTAQAYSCTGKGPTGEALFTDAVYFGRPDAKKLLVLVSATHGAEGYVGSAAQLLFMRAKFHEKLPASTAVLLVHALNCYGFAWDSCLTIEGCDLNRNFVDFSKPLPANPGYEELAEHLAPADIGPEAIKRAEAAIEAYRSVHGDQKFREARSSGQYTMPGGHSFGGGGPTEARRTLEQIALDFNAAARDQVIIIDYHSGLGPYGYGELQCELASGLAGYDRATSIFGPSVTSPELGTSSAVVVHGTQDDFWERLLGNRHTYVCLEFGTYDAPRIRGAMRDDLWLVKHRSKEADSELGRRIRNECKLNFYPQKPDWMEMVLSRSHQVHRQAWEALVTWTTKLDHIGGPRS